MKLVNYCFLLLALGLSVGAAKAQCVTVPNDPTAFVAVDVLLGVTVDAFCVGREVRFEQRQGRNIPISQLYYTVLPGVGTTIPNCTAPSQNYTYLPTQANVGMVTVSENSNVLGNGTYYIRTYQVFATPAPTFTVAPCPNGSVLVTLTDTNPYDSYRVTVGSTTQAIARNQPVSIATNGATAVTITGDYSLNGVCDGIATQPIPALAPAQKPVFSNLTLQAPLPAGPATLALSNLPAGYLYTLQVEPAGGGGFRDVATVPAGSTSFTLPSPVTAGCYRIFRNDFCGTSPDFSTALCPINLTGNSAQNRNQLLFSAPGGTYTVTRDGSPVTGLTTISGGLEDPNVQCGTSYTYRVTTTQADGSTSVSNPVTILTQSAIPPAQPKLLASFNLNDVVELTPLLATASLPAGSTLSYSRATGGAPAPFRTASSVRLQRDSTALATLLAQPPCYSVQLIDICGNSSPESPATCPALLSASPADPAGSSITLTWTAFTGPDANIPATYAIQRLATDGTVLSTIPVNGTSFTDLAPPTDRQVARYRLQVSGAGLPTGTFSYSNRASVTRQPFLTIPTAFTPNNDGLNDVLEVKGKYLQDYTFVVVDRNGMEVFRSSQRSQTWDGTIRGHVPVLGAYVWRFQQDGEDGKTFKASGTVTILQ